MVGGSGGPTGIICQHPLGNLTFRQHIVKGTILHISCIKICVLLSNKSYIIFWAIETSKIPLKIFIFSRRPNFAAYVMAYISWPVSGVPYLSISFNSAVTRHAAFKIAEM